MQKQLHICIVSDQTLQNLIPAYQYKADTVVLAHSERTLGNAKIMKKCLLKKGIQAILGSELLPADAKHHLPSQQLSEIHRYGELLVKTIKQKFPDTSIILNATGGNKLMAFGLMIAMRNHIDQTIYADTANAQIEFLIPKNDNFVSAEKMQNVLDIESYLSAQGYEIIEKPFTKAQQIDDIKTRAPLTHHLAKHAEYLSNQYVISHINETLSRALNPTINKNGKSKEQIEAEKEQKILENLKRVNLFKKEWENDPIICEIRALANTLNLAEWKAQENYATFSSKKNAEYFNGIWLEEYVLLAALEADPTQQILNDMQTDVEVIKDHNKNQFDFLAISQNQLLVVECKTVNLNDKQKGTDIAYKLDSVGNNAKGLFGNNWLVLSSPLYKKNHRALLNRASDLKITLIPGQHLSNLKDYLQRWAESKKAPNILIPQDKPKK